MLFRFAGCTALISGTLLPFLVVPAHAQAAPALGDATRSVDNSADIIVTATRRSERLQDVPISVTAVTGDTLTQRGVTSPEELARLSPTLTSQSNASNAQGTNFSIRGVGTGSFQRTIESSVATVIDDVTLIRPEMGILNFTDIEQVEVLNGPQGMLFGKNASAGLINVRTKNPVRDETSLRVGTEYGRLNTSNNTSQFRAFGVANLPISSTLTARVNVTYQDNSPTYRNLAVNPRFEGALRQIIVGGKLLWEPTDRLSVLASGDYMNSRGLGPGVFSFRYVAPGSPDNFFLGAVGITPGPDNTLSAYNAPTYANTNLGGGQVRINYDLGGGLQLTNITAYRGFRTSTGFDADYGPASLAELVSEPRSFQQLTNELRIASPTGGRFDYQVGLYALRGGVHQRSIVGASLGMPVPSGFTYALGGDAQQRQKLGSYAAFGQGTYRLTDALRVILGGRLTYDEITMRYSATANGAVSPLRPVTSEQSAKLHNTNLSWRGILQYDVDRDVMLYATAAKGYKGPGFTEYTLQSVRPEISTHFEIGAKTQFLDRRLTLNLSAYHTAFRDFQAQVLNLSTISILVQNAGKLVTQGFDAQLSARLAPGLTLSGGLAYTDARYRSFEGDLCYPGQSTATCTGGLISNSSGNRLPNAPKWKGVGDIRYERPLTSSIDGSIQIGFTSQTSVEYFSNADPQGHLGGFTTMDVVVGLAGQAKSWKLNLFCRNCTDHRYAGAISNTALIPSDYVQNYSYGAFRSLGAALEFTF
jgi:iron complex outermembrane receptor protein